MFGFNHFTGPLIIEYLALIENGINLSTTARNLHQSKTQNSLRKKSSPFSPKTNMELIVRRF